MEEKKTKKINKKPYILIPILIVILIYLFVFILKKIYPFGNNTIAQGDLSLLVIYITYLRRILLSGNLSKLFFTPLTLGGNYVIGNVFLINPFMILYFIGKNDNNLIYYMSYIQIIKTVICVITSYICFNKFFNKKPIIVILATLQYSMSAYVLINYSTTYWMDIVILFPLFVLGIKKIIEENKIGLYVVTLALITLETFQLTYMILLSVILSLFVYFKIYKPINKRKIILNIGIATLIGVLLPTIFTIFILNIYSTSYRFGMNDIQEVPDLIWTKISYLVYTATLVFCFEKSFKYLKKDLNIRFFIIMIILTGIIPVLFEGVNIIWHGGQYDSFPFRYGFIPIFYMIMLSGYYLNTYEENKEKNLKVSYMVISYILAIFDFAILIYIACLISNIFPVFYTSSKIVLYLFLHSILTTIRLKFFSKDENLSKNLLIILITELFILSLGFFVISNDDNSNITHTDKVIKNDNYIISELNDKLDYTSGYRYKDNSFLTLECFPLQTNLPSIATWLQLPKEHIDSYNMLGYSNYTLRLKSYGGTIFTDSLLGVKYAFSKDEMNLKIYDLLGKTSNGINLYSNRNSLQFGIIYNNDLDKNIDEFSENQKFMYQNYLYKTIFNQSNDLMEEVNIENFKLEDNEITDNLYYCYNLTVPENCIIYAYAEKESNNYGYSYFTINDEVVTESYPNINNNNIIDLGYYDEGTNVKIGFILADKEKINKLHFGILNYDEYLKIFENQKEVKYSNNNNELYFSCDSDKESSKLLIPYFYENNMKVYRNGKEIEAKKVLGDFISVDLEEGTNDIKIVFENYYLLKIGTIISIFSIILFIIYNLIKKYLLQCDVLLNLAYGLFVILAYILLLYIYIWGIINTFILMF